MLFRSPGMLSHLRKIANGKRGKRVLIADDNPAGRELLREGLDGHAAMIVEASNGREALEKIREARPDLVLLDIQMPEMDGFTLTHAIKSDRRFEGIPVVMLSALATDANRLLGKEVGCDAYVRKFDAELLADTLCGFLSTLEKNH